MTHGIDCAQLCNEPAHAIVKRLKLKTKDTYVEMLRLCVGMKVRRASGFVRAALFDRLML